MKKKLIVIISVFVSIIIICSMYFCLFDTRNDIEIKMSRIVNMIDWKKECLYDERMDGYKQYACYLEINNKSRFDIYNIKIQNNSKDDRYIFGEYHYNSFDPYYIKSGDSSVVVICVYIKDDFSVNELISDFPKSIALNLVNPEKKNQISYSKTVICKYNLTDDDYSDAKIQYPIVV